MIQVFRFREVTIVTIIFLPVIGEATKNEKVDQFFLGDVSAIWLKFI
jgi:hypothetical protein